MIAHRQNAQPLTVRKVLHLWRGGLDSEAIGQRLQLSELAVFDILHAEQDRRYRERTAAHQTEKAR